MKRAPNPQRREQKAQEKYRVVDYYSTDGGLIVHGGIGPRWHSALLPGGQQSRLTSVPNTKALCVIVPLLRLTQSVKINVLH